MTKYIELLRKHQHDKTPTEPLSDDTIMIHNVGSDAANTVVQHVASSNPYSQPSLMVTADNNDTLAGLEGLIEESISSEVEISPSEEAVADCLIAEDEAELVQAQPVPQDAVTLDEEKAKDAVPTPVTITQPNSGAFKIMPWLQGVGHDVLLVFQAAQRQEPADISRISEQLRLLLDHVDVTPSASDALELEINRMIKNIRDIDESVGDLVQKSIMMMLYAIKTGQQLKLQQQELIHHIIAAMLHHIGMAMVPDDIRHKKERLTRKEVKRIKEAPQDAHDYLQTCHIEDENILLAAAQAAERYDGSGSTGLKGHEIAWSARLIGLLSMFEALIHFRPYRQRLLPRDAIRELVNHHKKAFDPVMLKALIESISLYPVGTFVQINTGEIGQVIAVHNKFPLRPIIHISMDRHARAINEREINLKAQPNLMIQKCMYEESLVEMRQEHVSG